MSLQKWLEEDPEPKQWLKDTHMDAALNMLRKRYKAHPEWLRSDKICILDTTLGNIWNMRYHDFVDFPANEDGTGRKLPGGSWDYYTGQMPEYEKLEKT
ncbi:unnamed protein product [Arabis nemorensis]|uniref:Uncharacterized protein n=1 Tax=Arabis nemorensis TaxID=586526 RepID=A0A565BT40_9BRAS|nr:unnamed protein product [Arabis nemorensis]